MTSRTGMAGLFRVLAHPTRLAIIRRLHELQAPASPSDLADDLGEQLGNASYHVRFLVDAGLLTLVRTEPRRGAVEHYYRLTADVGPLLRALDALIEATESTLTRRKP